jgi:hypothetical protein
MQQSQTQIRGTQSLLVAAREAANYNEPWTKRVAERHEVTAENVTERVSPRYVSLIIDQAKRIDPKDAKISTLFSADAYDILCVAVLVLAHHCPGGRNVEHAASQRR